MSIPQACCALAQTIDWNPSSLTLVARGGNYARMARAHSGDLLCVFEQRGEIRLARSADEGKTWSSPVRVATFGHGHPSNPELLALGDGRILCPYNERPNDGVHPYTICVTISDDDGRTWSPRQLLFEADTTHENGCWEPAAIQLPDGRIQIYFANESPYRSSREQEISVLTSADAALGSGSAWQGPTTVCFRPESRDGMPVPTLLASGDIAVAIEDNGLSGGRFKPVVVRTASDDFWKSGPVGGSSPDRWSALAEPLPASRIGAAPYLVTMPTGDTVLSAQVHDSYDEQPVMTVWVGDELAQGFAGPTRPFAPDEGKGCYWNALFPKSEDVVTAITGATINGQRGVWIIDGTIGEAQPQPQP